MVSIGITKTDSGENHLVQINFFRITSAEQLANVLDLNGLENLVKIVEGGSQLSPLTYFTFTNKQEFYVVESNAIPAQKSLSDSAAEAVAEKYNALQETLTGALSSSPVEELKGKATDALSWAKSLVGKK